MTCVACGKLLAASAARLLERLPSDIFLRAGYLRLWALPHTVTCPLGRLALRSADTVTERALTEGDDA